MCLAYYKSTVEGFCLKMLIENMRRILILWMIVLVFARISFCLFFFLFLFLFHIPSDSVIKQLITMKRRPRSRWKYEPDKTTKSDRQYMYFSPACQSNNQKQLSQATQTLKRSSHFITSKGMACELWPGKLAIGLKQNIPFSRPVAMSWIRPTTVQISGPAPYMQQLGSLLFRFLHGPWAPCCCMDQKSVHVSLVHYQQGSSSVSRSQAEGEKVDYYTAQKSIIIHQPIKSLGKKIILIHERLPALSVCTHTTNQNTLMGNRKMPVTNQIEQLSR